MRPKDARTRRGRPVPWLCALVFLWACDCKGGGGPDVTLDMRADDSREESEGENGDEEETEGIDGEEGDLEDPSDEDLDAQDVEAIEVEDNAGTDFCERLAEAFCDYVTACCDEGEREILAPLVDCDSPLAGSFFLDCYAGLGPHVSDGTAEIYEEAISGCLALFWDMEMRCPDFNAAPSQKPWYKASGCSEVARGTLSPSEACAASVQCDGPYYCDESSDEGACTPQSGDGAPCVGDEACLPGLACVFETCGEPSAESGNCDGDGDCRIGLYCDEEGGSRCLPMLQEDESCVTDDDVCAGRCAGTSCVGFCDGLL
jgi:hypothetical protein